MHLTLLSALAATTITLVNAYANPMPCSGQCRDTHDPSLIRRASDGKYFRFATGGQMSIYTAPALTGPWTAAGKVLPTTGSKIPNPGSKDAWAPNVHYLNNEYVLYYSVSQFGTQDSAIGVATSATMESGSWVDHGATGVASKNGDPYNAIDANLITVGGTNVMTFGSYWEDIYQTTLSADGLRASGTKPYQVAFNSSTAGTHLSEGAYVFAQGGAFFLFFSSGRCCGYDKNRPRQGEEYKIMVCRSNRVDGGYVDQNGVDCLEGGGTIVLQSHGNVYGPGGQGVYEDPKYGPVLYYHYVDITRGYADGDKLLGINTIDFSTGWPVV